MNRETCNRKLEPLERKLSQRIQALYRTHLEHQPAQVTCQLFENKILIVLENSIIRPVQLLAEQGKRELAQQVRLNINKVIERQLKALIEEVVGIPVVDLLSDDKLETGRTGIIAVLSHAPQFRHRASIPQVKPEKEYEDSDE